MYKCNSEGGQNVKPRALEQLKKDRIMSFSDNQSFQMSFENITAFTNFYVMISFLKEKNLLSETKRLKPYKMNV